MSYTSFKKGEEFEKFVENVLFKEDDYVLIHRTNSFEQNKERYSEETLRPDFKFRSKITGVEFYVEAKYRSNFNYNDMLEIMSFEQQQRFAEIQKKEGIKVLIVIGYEGEPKNPKEISLIPLDKLKYLELYPSFLRKFSIEKTSVNLNQFNLKFDNSKLDNSKLDNSKLDNEKLQNSQKSQINNIKENNKFLKLIKYVLISLISIAIIYLTYDFFNNDYETELRNKTTEYYKIIESKNFNELKNYLAPNVEKWYGKSNLNFNQIKLEIENYNKKYPKNSTEVQWDTYEAIEIKNGYLVTYKLIYKIFNKNKNENKLYHLKIKAIWNKDYKIRSITEEKIL